jgi:hypothetical protein
MLMLQEKSQNIPVQVPMNANSHPTAIHILDEIFHRKFK